MTRFISNYLGQQVHTTMCPVYATGPFLIFEYGMCDVERRNDYGDPDIIFVEAGDKRYVAPDTPSTNQVWVVNVSVVDYKTTLETSLGTITKSEGGKYTVSSGEGESRSVIHVDPQAV